MDHFTANSNIKHVIMLPEKILKQHYYLTIDFFCQIIQYVSRKLSLLFLLEINLPSSIMPQDQDYTPEQ